MKLRHVLRIGCAVMGLMAQSASAGVVDDVKAGQDLFLNGVAATLEGQNYGAQGYVIPKSAGSLDLDVTLSDFGVNDNQPIHASARVNGDFIIWSFDKTFDPPVDIDGTNSLDRAYGQISVKASTLSGFELAQCSRSPCARDVRLYLAVGTQVMLEGTSYSAVPWTETLSVRQFKAMGGVPRPDLASLRAPARLYAKATTQQVTLGVGLSSIAPLNGAKVDFSSSAPDALQIQPDLIIPQGNSVGTVTATLKPNFAGYVTVRAAANGASAQKIIEISPEGEAESRQNPWDKTLYVPPILSGCTMCSGYIDFTEERTGIAVINGTPMYFTPTEEVSLPERLGSTGLSPIDLSSTGWLTGTLVDGGGMTQAFSVNLGALDQRPSLLGQFTPVAINAYGMVVGNRRGGSGPVAIMQYGSEPPIDLPIGAASTEAKAMSEAGHIVGVLETSSGKQGFSYRAGRTLTLPAISRGAVTVPAAVNQFGVIAGSSVDAEGLRQAVRADASGNVSRLGVPPGYSQSWATSINDLGWIVGTASNGSGTTGFLWTPGSGLVDLNQLASPTEGFVVTEALKVTNNKLIVVKGTVAGQTDLYVLGL